MDLLGETLSVIMDFLKEAVLVVRLKKRVSCGLNFKNLCYGLTWRSMLVVDLTSIICVNYGLTWRSSVRQ